MTSGYIKQTKQQIQLSKTETLNIVNNAQPQSQYPDLPRKIHGATGGFLNNDFITCGGEDSFVETDKCYMLGSEGPFATMMRKRYLAASIVLEDEKLWVLGGSDGNSGLSSTEYIFSDGRNVEGPPMPMALARHAIVKIDETTSFLVGGRIGSYWIEKSWYYNGNWIDGPDLQKGRWDHSVGIVRDPATDQVYLVVTGGYTGYLINDVEILDVQENKWEPGKLLYL